jgi:hypothetical protein
MFLARLPTRIVGLRYNSQPGTLYRSTLPEKVFITTKAKSLPKIQKQKIFALAFDVNIRLKEYWKTDVKKEKKGVAASTACRK